MPIMVAWKKRVLLGGNMLLMLSLVEKSHALKDTVNYVEVFRCVKKEMKTPAKLLETLLERTASSLKKIHPSITSVDVKIEKTNPPVGGDVGSVAISKKV